MRAKLVEIKEMLNRMRHLPVPEQGRWLGHVMRGYFAYHAVPTNARTNTSFHHFVGCHWRRAPARRSLKAALPWKRMPNHRTLCKAARPSVLGAHAGTRQGAPGDARRSA